MNKHFLISFIFLTQVTYSLGVIAGTEISNVAQLDYTVDSVSFTSKSNTLVDIVDQKIDMQMVCQESESIVVGVGERKRAMPFVLKNIGNGLDEYVFTTLESENSDFSVNNAEVYLDDGDGIFSLANDTLVTQSTVPSDGNLSLFLVSDIPSDADKFSYNGIKASSTVQGSLVYGESKKLDDFYAVVATQENAKSDICVYRVSHLAVKLEKSATVTSDKVYIGSTIHYILDVKLVGEGTVEDVVITDDIPKGTRYIAESLKLDGVSAGDFNGTAISVALYSITKNAQNLDPKHQITFDVRVQ